MTHSTEDKKILQVGLWKSVLNHVELVCRTFHESSKFFVRYLHESFHFELSSMWAFCGLSGLSGLSQNEGNNVI